MKILLIDRREIPVTLAVSEAEKSRGKIADYFPKFLLCDSGTLVVPIFINHFRSLAQVKQCLTS